MASSSHPGAPFEDPGRVKPMEMIVEALGKLRLKTRIIKRLKTGYACLWLADIEKLKYWVDKILDEPYGPLPMLNLLEFDSRIGQRWQQKHQTGESVESRKGPGEFLDSPRRNRPRSQYAEDACRDRDKACILTKCSKDICQPCPLYPVWMNDENMVDVKLLFEGLRYFWSGKRVDGWYNAIYGDGFGPDKPENLILLSPTAYVLYARGYVAFEPVDRGPEGKWLTLRVWWLKRHEHEDGVDFRLIPQLPSDLHPSDYGVALHDARNDRPLLSGETITLETHDPENCPLPDSRILEMQWILNRVLALGGTVEPKDPCDDEVDEALDEELDY